MTPRSSSPLLMRRARPTVREVLLRKRSPVCALFSDIRSMYNVGAMLRTSDAALVSKVFLTGTTPCPPHKGIDKSALGAGDVVPWEHCPDSRAVIAQLKKQGVSIVALEITAASKHYAKTDYSFPLCLIVGNEVSGIDPEILEQCDSIVHIPMLGRARSLNVATAYGIALFEILRQHTL